MIDFRYHLVSIVSIFLALAVGIVLGAGPLQGSIGTQLTDQVGTLRQEKDTLRSQLDDARKTVSAQEEYAALVASAALAGRLRDASVAVLVTPDSAGAFSQNVQLALRQAGARITTVVTLKDAYRDPGHATDRAAAATRAAGLAPVPASGDGDAVLAAVLAKVLVRPQTTAPAPVASASEALSALRDANLLDYTQSDLSRADLAVLLQGPISGTTTSVTAQSATLMKLATALDQAGSGLVVATGQTTTGVRQEETTSLVALVRKDAAAAKTISTVDHADTTTGAGVLVLTLARQRQGATDHVGTGAGAPSPVPPAP